MVLVSASKTLPNLAQGGPSLIRCFAEMSDALIASVAVEHYQLAKRCVYSVFLGAAIACASLSVAAAQDHPKYDRLEQAAQILNA